MSSNVNCIYHTWQGRFAQDSSYVAMNDKDRMRYYLSLQLLIVGPKPSRGCAVAPVFSWNFVLENALNFVRVGCSKTVGHTKLHKMRLFALYINTMPLNLHRLR
jgi:hypothetical protein